MHSNKTYIGVGILSSLTLLSGAILSSPKASADTSGTVDITVNVNAACSLTPANTTLTQTIAPGTQGNIGTANLKAVCNDPSGFAIYAVGYTNNEYGNTDLVTELGTNYSIKTGTGTSASNWNMTIDNAETTGNYDATIENNFNQATNIPEVYTKIATVTSVTDQTIGTNLTADFNAYIAPDQPASTYQGKVKFILVHPADATELSYTTNSTKDITVTFNSGDDYYFYLDNNNNPVRTNTVTYHGECENEHVVMPEPEVKMTLNVNSDGTKARGLTLDNLEYNYYSHEYEHEDPYLFKGASKLKVVIDYDFQINQENPLISNAETDYSYYENAGIYVGDNDTLENSYYLYGFGTKREIIIDGDYALIALWLKEDMTIDTSHDYGFYATVYPLDEDGKVIEEETVCRCEWTITEGQYMAPYGHGSDLDAWSLTNDDFTTRPIREYLDGMTETELTVYYREIK